MAVNGEGNSLLLRFLMSAGFVIVVVLTACGFHIIDFTKPPLYNLHFHLEDCGHSSHSIRTIFCQHYACSYRYSIMLKLLCPPNTSDPTLQYQIRADNQMNQPDLEANKRGKMRATKSNWFLIFLLWREIFQLVTSRCSAKLQRP